MYFFTGAKPEQVRNSRSATTNQHDTQVRDATLWKPKTVLTLSMFIFNFLRNWFLIEYYYSWAARIYYDALGRNDEERGEDLSVRGLDNWKT